VNFDTEKWTHSFSQNGPTQVAIAIVAWDMRSRRILLWKIILGAAALKARKACAQSADARVREIGKQALSGAFAGREASLVEVSYLPGGRSPEHRHPGFIVGYVFEGQIRFAINHETPRVLGRGEMFYEPTGALHSTSENAQPGMPAKILAFMVAPRERPIVEGK
jgi:quercetin dioxygenase-like cupin family protein